jgi:hypothetical protein
MSELGLRPNERNYCISRAIADLYQHTPKILIHRSKDKNTNHLAIIKQHMLWKKTSL